MNASPSPFVLQIITLLPEMWHHMLGVQGGVVGRACHHQQKVVVHIVSLRDFAVRKDGRVDDTPYGGGPGMVLQVEPLHRAVCHARSHGPGPVLLLAPQGEVVCQPMIRRWAKGGGMILICGRYEGVDERICHFIDGRVAIADVVLSGGDPAAWCIADAVIRQLPGVLGNRSSLLNESFAQDGHLAPPQYTKPACYEQLEVPQALLSGDHGRIDAWRHQHSGQRVPTLRSK